MTERKSIDDMLDLLRKDPWATLMIQCEGDVAQTEAVLMSAAMWDRIKHWLGEPTSRENWGTL